jgi:phosphohistidine phosphatase
MVEAAAGLNALVAAEVVLTSPLVRAMQTAEIVAAALGKARIVQCEALATGDHDSLLEAAARQPGATVVAVGHEPHMSGAASWLLTGDEQEVALDVKKGAAMLIRFDGRVEAGAGTLVWALPPRALRGIGA